MPRHVMFRVAPGAGARGNLVTEVVVTIGAYLRLSSYLYPLLTSLAVLLV